MSHESPASLPHAVASTIDSHAEGLAAFIDASPSPFHAVTQVARTLEDAGFTALDETGLWPGEPGRFYVQREGSIAAWSTQGVVGGAQTPFRVLGGHTDSPNLRISPQPNRSSAGWDQLVVEVYGGPLLNSWLDRDLGLSGRVAVRQGSDVLFPLIRVDEPVLRVPQLAIHLDRDVNSGLQLNPQTHLRPVWGASGDAPSFAAYLGALVGAAERDILGWDVMAHDLTPARRIGRTADLLAAPRLDNLCTAYASARALIDALPAHTHGGDMAHVPLLVLFDHEEIGSTTNRGGFSTFLPSVLERIVLARGGGRENYLRALAGSLICSADMAHATHPNYPEKHEPSHQVSINGGPVLKINTQGRYASDASGAAQFARACEQAGVPLQTFRSRGDMPCGSTIGPMSAALTGAVTVDVGAPMLSMHSARELTGAFDPAMYVAALTAVLAPC